MLVADVQTLALACHPYHIPANTHIHAHTHAIIHAITHAITHTNRFGVPARRREWATVLG